MLGNLIFCLNATIPIFLLMLLGMFFMRIGLFNDSFVAKMNSFVFRIALPVLIFYDLCKEDFYRVWDIRYVLFCFFATALSILLVTGISYLLKNKNTQGEFIQVAYRSSAAILGVTLVENIYGSAGMTPLMILGVVPLYNVAAVIVLSFYKPDRRPLDRKLLMSTLRGIVTNPIIIGIVVGLLWSLLSIPMPKVLDTTVQSVARLATPLGIMAMGASFDLKKALSSIKTAGLGTFIKLFGLCCIFLPIACAMGFRQDKLVAALIMCGSPTTVSCYVMAREMGHEGTLTSSTVMLTTFFSAFSLTFWLFILKTMGML
jgi:predicted permease